MLHLTLQSATVIGLISCVSGLRAETAAEQLKSATIVLDEILSAPDKGIPKDLLDKAYGVVVVPGVKKVAFDGSLGFQIGPPPLPGCESTQICPL